MVRYYRVITYTPYSGEEFTGHCCFDDAKPEDAKRAYDFAELLMIENADENVYDHVDDLTDEEAREEFYEGCGIIWQEIDYKTYLEEAFEGDEEAFING